jgi:hypothetical protein
MKNIIDIYDDVSVTAGPGNTLGLGNPMAPTDTEVGSEPLTPCAKKQCKGKKKAKKIIEASILGDIEDTIQAGDDVVEFAQWFLEAAEEGFTLMGNNKFDNDGVLPAFVPCITSPSKGVFIVDILKIFDSNDKGWKGAVYLCDRIHLTEKSLKKLPKHVKTIKIYNFKYGDYQLSCYTNDISKLNIEVYADAGKSYGDIACIFWNKLKNKNIKLGQITCNKFRLGTYAAKIESIMLAKDSTMIEVDLSENENMTDIYGRFDHAMSVKFPRQLVARQLASAGIIPHGCELKIYG